MSNNAPKTEWRGFTMACGTHRQRLFVDGIETPYFIDAAKGVSAHRTHGVEYGLYGSGMHRCSIPARDGSPRYIAAVLGSERRVAPLKHRAEQMALGDH